jgi:hypothetical protein
VPEISAKRSALAKTSLLACVRCTRRLPRRCEVIGSHRGGADSAALSATGLFSICPPSRSGERVAEQLTGQRMLHNFYAEALHLRGFVVWRGAAMASRNCVSNRNPIACFISINMTTFRLNDSAGQPSAEFIEQESFGTPVRYPIGQVGLGILPGG